MAADHADIDAVLDGWRASGADRVDPMRFHRIAALQRRATARDGAARDALEATLAGLIDAYAARIGARRTHEGATGTAASARAMRSALGMLVDDLHARACAEAGGTEAAHRAGYPELAALDDFRQLWSTLRTGSQVRRSLAPPTEDAGPLNSTRLVHRALTLMRDLSPEYLQQFLAYADTLSWLESLQDAGVLTGRESLQPVGAKPRAKPRTRKRR